MYQRHFECWNFQRQITPVNDRGDYLNSTADFLGSYCDYLGSASDHAYLTAQVVTSYTHFTMSDLIKLATLFFSVLVPDSWLASENIRIW